MDIGYGAYAPTETRCGSLDAGLGQRMSKRQTRVHNLMNSIYSKEVVDPYYRTLHFDNLMLAYSNALLCPNGGLAGFESDLERIASKEIAPDMLQDYVAGMIDKYCS
jgi:hypothetical protein